MISLRRYIDTRLADAEKAVQAAREETNLRLDGMNEFRKALEDQTATFIPRPEVEAAIRRNTDRLDQMASEHLHFVGRPEHDALAAQITDINARLTRQEGATAGANNRGASLRQTVVMAVAIMGLLLTLVIALLDHYVSR